MDIASGQHNLLSEFPGHNCSVVIILILMIIIKAPQILDTLVGTS